MPSFNSLRNDYFPSIYQGFNRRLVFMGVFILFLMLSFFLFIAVSNAQNTASCRTPQILKAEKEINKISAPNERFAQLLLLSRLYSMGDCAPKSDSTAKVINEMLPLVAKNKQLMEMYYDCLVFYYQMFHVPFLETMEFADAKLAFSQMNRNAKEESIAWMIKGHVYRKMNKADSALICFENATTAFIGKVEYNKTNLNAIHNIIEFGLADASFTTKKYDKLLQVIERMSPVYQRAGRIKDLATFEIIKGRVSLAQKDYYKFNEQYARGLKMLDPLLEKNSGLQARVYHESGLIYQDAQNNKMARNYFLKAIKAMKNILGPENNWANKPGFNFSDIGQAYLNLAATYIIDFDFENALPYARLAYDFRLRSSDTASIMNSRWYLNYLLAQTGKYHAVLETSYPLVPYFANSIQKTYLKSMSQVLIGYCHEQLNNYDSAYYYYQQVYPTFNPDTLLKKVPNLHIGFQYITFTYNFFTRCAIRSKDVDKAILFHSLNSAYQDSSAKLHLNTEINQILLGYDVDTKQRKIDQLEDEKNIKQQLLQSQRFSIIALLLVLGLAVALAVIYYQRNRLRKETTVALTTQNKKLESSYSLLEQKLTENKNLNEFKELMVGMLVHDLKNPLNYIITLSGTRPVNPDNMEIIHQAGYTMLNLTLNMLDVQKFENIGVKLNKETFYWNEFLNTCRKQIMYLAEVKSINFRFESANIKAIHADLDLLTRTIINILTNAIKYAPFDSKIIIETLFQNDTSNRDLIINIHDNGPGIPEDKRKIIFEKFTQLSSSNSGNISATGLGLTLCKMVVEAHGGTIFVKESHILGGACFTIVLPNSVVSFEEQDAEPIIQPYIAKENKSANQFYFDADELRFILPLCRELSQLEYYESSDIFEKINKASLPQTPEIIRWRKILTNAVLQSNENLYLSAINIT